MCEIFNLKLKKICRGCLSESDELFPIFNNENLDIQKMFESCTSLKINENDGFSTMCRACIALLEQFYKFQQKCIQSDFKISCLKEKLLYNFDCNTLSPNVANMNDELIKDIKFKKNGLGHYQCNVCLDTFDTKEDLKHHLVTLHISLDQYVKRIKEKNSSKQAKDVLKIYQCKQCSKKYTSLNNLEIHTYSHTGVKPFDCKYCDKKFTKISCLNSHVSIHTGDFLFLCSECGKGFSTKSGLKRHKISHTGERPYKCNQCKAEFIASGDLTVHMRIHTGERPYLCPICGATFSRTSHLNTHMRIHTGEKPHKCATCEKAFAQAGDLRSHERTHTGEKPYQCSVCKKKFVQSSGLASHMRTHTGEKSFQCTICKKAFSQSSSLTRHKRYHNQKPI